MIKTLLVSAIRTRTRTRAHAYARVRVHARVRAHVRVRARALAFVAFSVFVAGNIVPAAPAPASATAATRLTLDFNPGWRFTKSDPTAATLPTTAATSPATPAATSSTAATSPADPAFDATGPDWTTVAAPHTYNDTDTFDNWSPAGHRGEWDQWSGRTWYRKTFTTPDAWRGKKVFIEFEAVRQIAEVYLNGHKLGASKTGFSPFGFDLTPHLRPAGDPAPNVLALMCDNRFMQDPDPNQKLAPGQDRPGSLHDMLAKMERDMPESIDDLAAGQIPWNNPHWHPAHGGIYRNVRLHVTDPLHITLPLYSFLETEGPYAYATSISAKNARVGIDVPIRNDRPEAENVTVLVEIYAAAAAAGSDATSHNNAAASHNNAATGNNAAASHATANNRVLRLDATTRIAPGATAKLTLAGDIPNPRLWEPAYPHLYRVVCTLEVDGKKTDTTEIPFGIRTVRWTADEGFFINGRHLKLRGWGQKPTDEWPGLGAAQPDWLHAHTLRLMRDAGGNFVRWGHAAAGPASIAAGDRLGIIALQPGADGEKDTTGAAWKLRSALFRDIIIYYRNNPSILIWEGGNQRVTREHAAELRAHMDTYDPHGGRAYAHRRADETTAAFMDIGIGTEGGREIARLPVVEGEYNREESPRRVWDDQSPPAFGYAAIPGKTQTYRLNSEQFALNQITHYLKKIAPGTHSGGANWIFSDSTSGGRVETEVARASGEVDAVRLPKEAYHVLQTLWTETPRAHILGHWTYPARTKKTIHVVANAGADDVELLLNGKTLGHAKPAQTCLFTFPDIAFDPGALTAISRRAGQKLAAHTLRTAGPAVALRMTPIENPAGGLTAGGSDIALIDVEAVDADGNRCPTWQNRVDFTLTGPAVWRGGYNSGKPDSINNTWLDLESGINRVAIKSTPDAGQITLKASRTGLKDATLTLTSTAPPLTTAALPPTSAARAVAHSLARTPGGASILPDEKLPQTAPAWENTPALATPQPPLVKSAATGAEKMAGRHTKTWSYSGPSSAIVHLETDARPGKNAYVDTDSPFPADLPAALESADWIQAANSDALYSAVDFVEISVPANTTITVAHDDRLPRPGWLTAQFKATPQKITILGNAMTLHERAAKTPESITMGDNAAPKTAPAHPNMYLVFVNKK